MARPIGPTRVLLDEPAARCRAIPIGVAGSTADQDPFPGQVGVVLVGKHRLGSSCRSSIARRRCLGADSGRPSRLARIGNASVATVASDVTWHLNVIRFSPEPTVDDAQGITEQVHVPLSSVTCA